MSYYLIFFVIFVGLTSAVIVTDERIEVDQLVNLIKVAEFGFREGGEFSYRLKARRSDGSNLSPSTVFLFCTSDEIRTLFSDTRNAAFCKTLKDRQIGCSYAYSYPNGTSADPSSEIVISKRRVERRSFYWLALTNCDDQSFIGTQSYELVNPGGRHLDTGEERLPDVQVSFIALWSLAGIAFFVHWVRYPAMRARPVLPVFLTVLPALAMINNGIRFASSSSCDRTGRCSRHATLRVIQAINIALYRSSVFSASALFAKGWGTSRMALEGFDLKIFNGMLAVVSVTAFCNDFYENGYVVLAAFLVFLCCIYIVLSSLIVLLKLLRAQLDLLRGAGFDPPSSAVYAKLAVVIIFRRALFSYIVAKSFAFFVGSFFLSETRYIRTVTEQVIELSYFIALALVCRVRGTAAPTLRFSPLGEPAGAASNHGGHGASSPSAIINSWDSILPHVLSGPKDGPDAPGSASGGGAIVVVQNPITYDQKAGKFVPSIGVGTLQRVQRNISSGQHVAVPTPPSSEALNHR